MVNEYTLNEDGLEVNFATNTLGSLLNSSIIRVTGQDSTVSTQRLLSLALFYCTCIVYIVYYMGVDHLMFQAKFHYISFV